MDSEKEAERLRAARNELASRLNVALGFAINTGLPNEAALIAKLIEATITNTTNKLYVKLTSN